MTSLCSTSCCSFDSQVCYHTSPYNSGAKEEANASYFSITGLTTLFNALTQTTATVCSGGQCFTIYSNSLASSLSAFGVTVTSISTILVPICCLLLTYSVYSIYKTKHDCSYKPFQMGLVGAVLIALDNFILGDKLQMHSIPSYVGNVLLIVGSIWNAKEGSKERVSFRKK